MLDKSKNDRRARKSIHALWLALFELMKVHNWPDISVQMIADRADVARSTFYAHFQTKQDLLDAGFAMLGSGVRSQLLAMPVRAGHLATLDWLVAHMQGNREFLQRANGSNVGQIIQGRFRQTIQSLLAEEMSRTGTVPAQQDDLFLAGGIFAVIMDWAARGCPEDADRLSASLARSVFAYVAA